MMENSGDDARDARELSCAKAAMMAESGGENLLHAGIVEVSILYMQLHADSLTTTAA